MSKHAQLIDDALMQCEMNLRLSEAMDKKPADPDKEIKESSWMERYYNNDEPACCGGIPLHKGVCPECGDKL